MAQKPVSGISWLQQIRDNFTELYLASLTVLASAAEALAGSSTTKAVTPAGLEGAIANIDALSFVGHNNTGACTLTGVKVGDEVLSVTGVASGTVGVQGAKFETVITVNDQIQQTDAGNLSANVYVASIYRKS